MGRVLIMVLAIIVGSGIGFFISEHFKENVVVDSFANVSAPKIVSRIEVTEIFSRNTAVAVRENTTFGKENNAAMMLQWTSVAQIGVDFTTFKWGSLSGIGQPVPETGTISISGTLPPLEILNNFSPLGQDDTYVISRNANFDEEAVLGPILTTQKTALMKCVAESALYRADTIENAHRVILSLISAAIPPRADGTPIVTFNLKFANEATLNAEISNLGGDPKACENKTTL
ncbi:MAG: hypothetical protein WA790_19640 [Sulfitobacter sp.]